MTRKPQQTRSKMTVDAIIEAAFISVAERGPSATTTRHIADIAGIGVGSVYEYFTNKEEIFAAMNDRFVSEVTQMIRSVTPALVRLPINEAIYELIMSFAQLLRANDERYVKCARASMLFDRQDKMGSVYRALMDLFIKHTMNHPEHMQLRNVDTMSYIFINSGVFTLVRHMTDPTPTFSFEDLAQGLADMVGHYVSKELELLQTA